MKAIISTLPAALAASPALACIGVRELGDLMEKTTWTVETDANYAQLLGRFADEVQGPGGVRHVARTVQHVERLAALRDGGEQRPPVAALPLLRRVVADHRAFRQPAGPSTVPLKSAVTRRGDNARSRSVPRASMSDSAHDTVDTSGSPTARRTASSFR